MSSRKNSKAKYCEVLNKLLGVEVDWTKLTLEELIQIANVFDKPEELATKLHLHTQVAEQQVGRLGLKLLDNWDGPVTRLVRELMLSTPSKKKEVGSGKAGGE